VCNGKGSVVCSTCKGTTKKKCHKCNGTGYIPQSIKCITCNGSGQVEDEKFRAWINSLRGFSVDRLRDEKDRRRHKISGYRSKLGQLQSELREGWDDWETDPASSNNCRHGWTPNDWGHNGQITELEANIESLEEEIDIVQEILDTKLK
jgi:hypothetical protein